MELLESADYSGKLLYRTLISAKVLKKVLVYLNSLFYVYNRHSG